MDLRTKEKKIRDLIVYEFSILPKEIDIGRLEIGIKLNKDQVEALNLDTERVSEFLEEMLKRKTIVSIE